MSEQTQEAPTRASTFPTDAVERKHHPVASGVLDYFPDALVAVAHVSWTGNQQHNPGEPLHWAREKSTDEADALLRHFLERGSNDSDGVRHSAKMAWRALALLQKEIEAERNQASAKSIIQQRCSQGYGLFHCSLSAGHPGPHRAFEYHNPLGRLVFEWEEPRW